MKEFDTLCDIPEGYVGPELLIVAKKPSNHKARYRKMTGRNKDYEKIYLVEKALRKCKYFYEPTDGLIMYWANLDELREMMEYILLNPGFWEMGGSDDDAYSLIVGSYEEED